MRSAAGRRVFTYLRGRGAERVALVWLLLRGYRPLARRFAASGGEIDLIVRRGGTVAFVEVKTRASMEDALSSIGATKRRRISLAARAWLARNPALAGLTLRGDAVFVAPGALPAPPEGGVRARSRGVTRGRRGRPLHHAAHGPPPPFHG